MLRPIFRVPLISLVLLLLSKSISFGQCTNANVNWDYLDYLQTTTASYSTYINTPAKYTSMVQTQAFALGRSRLTITHNYTSANNRGENTTNTAEAGSRGTGADVQWIGNGVVTITFDTIVTAASFSLYDIDRSQIATVTAANGGTPVNVTMAKLSGTILTITGSGTPTAVATSVATTVANANTDGTINVDIAGPLTTIVITITASGTCASSCGTGGTEDGSFWLSDIQACVVGSFPLNYYAISQPFTGQPEWILAVHDLNTVYKVDPATGRAVAVFQDTDPRVREINDLAYDPYKRIIYYSVDGLERCTPAGTPDSIKHIKKYDVDAETISTIISNVNNTPLNIPTFYYGLESAAGAFYNASLYQGVEGTQSGSTSTGREAIVWRIDFNTDSITPSKASQVFALPVDNGSSLLHDWGDIVIKDGIMYDFNAGSSGGTGNYNYFDLQTCTVTSTTNGSITAHKPRQAGQRWDGQIYWFHDSVTVYNGTNVLTTPKRRIVAAARSATWVAGAGDAAEAFKPKADFGDAPASYDPNPLSPAMHERDTALCLGQVFTNDWDWEWSKQTSSNATGDGQDDNDGLLYTPVLNPGYGNYLAYVRVYNNTTANATLIAWLDYNNNGVFDASEAITPITVPSSASSQGFYLYWSGIGVTVPYGSYTFLRIRLTSTTNGMTTSNPTGYFGDGEVEDYRVIVDNFPLAVDLLSFDAKAVNNTVVNLSWKTTNEKDLAGYGIERSADGNNWSTIGFVSAKGNGLSGIMDYAFTDLQPLRRKSYYRLKPGDQNGTFRYSDIREVVLRDMLDDIRIVPNPARLNATVYVNSMTSTEATVILQDMQGKRWQTKKQNLSAGSNTIVLDNLNRLPAGTYVVQVVTGQFAVNRKLVID